MISGSSDEIAPRYAALLRAYPRSWRVSGRVDEMLSVLLEGAEAEGRHGPTAAETVDLLVHGLAARARTAAAVVPVAARTRIAQVSLTTGAALAGFLFAFGELQIPGVSDGTSPGYLDEWMRAGWGPFLSVGPAIYTCWFLAVGMYVAGRISATRELALIAVAVTLLVPALSLLTHHQRPPGGLLAALAVLGIGVVAHPARPSVSRPARLTILATAVAGAVALGAHQGLAAHRTDGYWPSSILTSRTMFYWSADGDGTQINRVLASLAWWALAALGAGALLMWSRDRSWVPAIAFLVIPVALLRLGTSNFSAAHAGSDAFLWICGALSVVALHALVVNRVLVLSYNRRRRGARALKSPERGTPDARTVNSVRR